MNMWKKNIGFSRNTEWHRQLTALINIIKPTTPNNNNNKNGLTVVISPDLSKLFGLNG